MENISPFTEEVPPESSETPKEKISPQSDEEAFEVLKKESLERIRLFYTNTNLKRNFPEFFGTSKEINRDVKQYLRAHNISREYLSNPVQVEEKEVEELLRVPEFSNDADFMMEVIRLNQLYVLNSARELLVDHDFLMKLLNEFGAQILISIYNNNERLPIDEEVVIEGIKKDPQLLGVVCDRVKNEKDFVYKAISANPNAVRFLPPYTGPHYVGIFFKHALQSGYAERFAVIPDSLEDDKEANYLLAKNTLSLRGVSHRFVKDPDLLREMYSKENVMRVLRKDISSLQHLPLSVLEDRSLMSEIQSTIPSADQYIQYVEHEYGKKFL
jgi:2,4-dienoyl-CoA reductase-like NADH-dependent reductase (Old Yellow Enzyme family)